jgi:hypothetical protein
VIVPPPERGEEADLIQRSAGAGIGNTEALLLLEAMPIELRYDQNSGGSSAMAGQIHIAA